MSKRSLFSTVWNSIRRTISKAEQEKILVGSDDSGNKYYEKKTAANKRGSRWFETKDGVGSTDSFDIDTVPEVPLEWDAWLRGGRNNPPTPQEISQNIRRSQQAVSRAKKLGQQAQLDKAPAGEPSQPADSHSASFKSQPVSSKFPEYPDMEKNPSMEKKQ